MRGTRLDYLHLKHRLATSPLAGPLVAARRMVTRLRGLSHPELALLRDEDRMMDAVLERLLTRTSVCVDVGAHIGSMTAMFCKLAPEGAHVVIEAVPKKAGWLRDRFPGLTVVQTALSDAEGEVVFYENLDKPGFSSLGARAGRTRELRVPCTTLDAVLKDRTQIDFIKIDVEGFELDVVRGAASVIERCRPVLLFEAGSATDPDIDNAKYAELLRLLDAAGYEVRPVFGAYFGTAPITEEIFMACRRYPFQAFNYIARPRA